ASKVALPPTLLLSSRKTRISRVTDTTVSVTRSLCFNAIQAYGLLRSISRVTREQSARLSAPLPGRLSTARHRRLFRDAGECIGVSQVSLTGRVHRGRLPGPAQGHGLSLRSVIRPRRLQY